MRCVLGALLATAVVTAVGGCGSNSAKPGGSDGRDGGNGALNDGGGAFVDGGVTSGADGCTEAARLVYAVTEDNDSFSGGDVDLRAARATEVNPDES